MFLKIYQKFSVYAYRFASSFYLCYRRSLFRPVIVLLSFNIFNINYKNEQTKMWTVYCLSTQLLVAQLQT